MNQIRSFTDIASLLKMNKGNLIKFIKKRGYKTVSYRSENNRGQMVKGLNEDDYQDLLNYRKNGVYLINEDKIQKDEFYLILLAPELSPNRVKLGFTSDLEQRMEQYRTICPTNRLIQSW